MSQERSPQGFARTKPLQRQPSNWPPPVHVVRGLRQEYARVEDFVPFTADVGMSPARHRVAFSLRVTAPRWGSTCRSETSRARRRTHAGRWRRRAPRASGVLLAGRTSEQRRSRPGAPHRSVRACGEVDCVRTSWRMSASTKARWSAVRRNADCRWPVRLWTPRRQWWAARKLVENRRRVPTSRPPGTESTIRGRPAGLAGSLLPEATGGSLRRPPQARSPRSPGR